MEVHALHGSDGNRSFKFTNQGYLVFDGLVFKYGHGIGNKGNEALTGNCNNIVIRNCSFTKCRSSIFFNNGTYSANYVTVYNNTFENCMGNIKCYGTESQYWDIYNNSVYECGYTHGTNKWVNSGDAEGVGLQRHKYTHIHHNSFIGGDTKPIMLWGHSGYAYNNVFIYNNFIRDTGRVGIYVAGQTGCNFCGVWIYNNILVRPSASGLSIASGNGIAVQQGSAGSAMNYILNNTLVAANGQRGIRVEPVPGSGATNMYWTVRNNIVYCEGSFDTYSMTYISRSQLVSSNNLIDEDGKWYYETYPHQRSLSFMKGIGQESNSIIGNPLFKSPGGSSPLDYQITSTSPAKRAGVSVGLSVDYVGRPWRNPPSIGAFEVSPHTGLRMSKKLEMER